MVGCSIEAYPHEPLLVIDFVALASGLMPDDHCPDQFCE